MKKIKIVVAKTYMPTVGKSKLAEVYETEDKLIKELVEKKVNGDEISDLEILQRLKKIKAKPVGKVSIICK
ncbi:unnamed protein product [marine sediment metagenome]|uniref:Uncharacterized protein n=1 Tax=marine sediment metagenome TaxID=412755 RepID=X0TUW9_9ZZZZ